MNRIGNIVYRLLAERSKFHLEGGRWERLGQSKFWHLSCGYSLIDEEPSSSVDRVFTVTCIESSRLVFAEFPSSGFNPPGFLPLCHYCPRFSCGIQVILTSISCFRLPCHRPSLSFYVISGFSFARSFFCQSVTSHHCRYCAGDYSRVRSHVSPHIETSDPLRTINSIFPHFASMNFHETQNMFTTLSGYFLLEM